MDAAGKGRVVQDFLNDTSEDLTVLDGAILAAERLVAAAVAHLKKEQEGSAKLRQTRSHALAWFATYAAGLRAVIEHGKALQEEGLFGKFEKLLISICVGEYLEQIKSGIPISQNEIVRLREIVGTESITTFVDDACVQSIIVHGNTPEKRDTLVALWLKAGGEPSLGATQPDETLDAMRAEMRRYADAEIAPHAHGWHLANAYIPQSVLDELGQFGVFGLTISEAYGGIGLSKSAMCVVTEELSRGYLGVGSLGTRSEIAAELIAAGGTEEQKGRWLPRIASGEILPTAVFTEPDFGSDLASLTTRAKRVGDHFEVTGNKTWITHASRANLMVMLVRTKPDIKGYRGLSILLAEKTPGAGETLFPDAGIEGTEIEVLGYRGMKEFELSFNGFKVPVENLLGGVEGEGFKQLMQTFEVARIQTGARAVGVSIAAFNKAWQYANERTQFGRPLVSFDRISSKMALMAAEILISRHLVYFAARMKDQDKRCDVEAGMAKLLAARVAWACADTCVQVHGGNGFALESEASRLLCDGRVLSIFEGAAEIQAEVIARGLLNVSN